MEFALLDRLTSSGNAHLRRGVHAPARGNAGADQDAACRRQDAGLSDCTQEGASDAKDH
jgi:hypothetical protein